MTRLDDLQAIEAAVWFELEARAARQAATAGVWGCWPPPTGRPRCAHIVLRDVHADEHRLLMFTDSAVAQGGADRGPSGRHARAVVGQPLGWQLRLRVQLGIESSGLAVSSRWARLKMSPAAQDYLSPLPPARRSDTPRPNAAAASTSAW
jgi:pyridoxamine 5'-phosphate oxidase